MHNAKTEGKVNYMLTVDKVTLMKSHTELLHYNYTFIDTTITDAIIERVCVNCYSYDLEGGRLRCPVDNEPECPGCLRAWELCRVLSVLVQADADLVEILGSDIV